MDAECRHVSPIKTLVREDYGLDEDEEDDDDDDDVEGLQNI